MQAPWGQRHLHASCFLLCLRGCLSCSSKHSMDTQEMGPNGTCIGTHTPHAHTPESTHLSAHTPPPICLLGAQGTRWSSVPFYPQHLAGTRKNPCREELGEPASTELPCSHPFLQEAPLRCCPQGSPTRPPRCLCTPAALAVFHLHLPHHSCLPGSPPTPCCPSGH